MRKGGEVPGYRYNHVRNKKKNEKKKKKKKRKKKKRKKKSIKVCIFYHYFVTFFPCDEERDLIDRIDRSREEYIGIYRIETNS